MKFGKLLAQSALPDGLMLRYKELKKQLKAMPTRPGADLVGDAGGDQASGSASQAGAASAQGPALSPDERAFIATLEEDLQRFNRFFMEQEERSVIRLQALADRLAAARGHPAALIPLKAALVDFHGEMVLLLHWSLLNYAAVVKILKKHDKRTGLLLRAPYLEHLLSQPFHSTSVMSRLVKRAEEQINGLVLLEQQQEQAAPAAAEAGAAPPAADAEAAAAAVPPAARSGAAASSAATATAGGEEAGPSHGAAAAAAAHSHRGLHGGEPSSSASEALPVDTAVFRRTQQALDMWNALRANVSTPSTVLPADTLELVRQLELRQQWQQRLGAATPIVPGGGGDGGAGAEYADADEDGADGGGVGVGVGVGGGARRRGGSPVGPAGSAAAGSGGGGGGGGGATRERERERSGSRLGSHCSVQGASCGAGEGLVGGSPGVDGPAGGSPEGALSGASPGLPSGDGAGAVGEDAARQRKRREGGGQGADGAAEPPRPKRARAGEEEPLACE